MNRKLTLMTIVNKQNSDKGMGLLLQEKKKISFLNPEISLIDTCKSYEDYNKFCIENISQHFKTDFVLLVQFDGLILNPNSWTNDFFNYDYVGAPWMSFRQLKYFDGIPDIGKLVGNGGFSLRSKRLCELLSKKYLNFYKNGENEDVFICQHIRNHLLCEGIKFAPYDVAYRFSVESLNYTGQFGAHGGLFYNGCFHNLKRESNKEIESLYKKITGNDL